MDLVEWGYTRSERWYGLLVPQSRRLDVKVSFFKNWAGENDMLWRDGVGESSAA